MLPVIFPYAEARVLNMDPGNLACMAVKVLVAFVTSWLAGTTFRAFETSPVSSAPDTAPSFVELDLDLIASTTLSRCCLILPCTFLSPFVNAATASASFRQHASHAWQVAP